MNGQKENNSKSEEQVRLHKPIPLLNFFLTVMFYTPSGSFIINIHVTFFHLLLYGSGDKRILSNLIFLLR